MVRRRGERQRVKVGKSEKRRNVERASLRNRQEKKEEEDRIEPMATEEQNSRAVPSLVRFVFSTQNETIALSIGIVSLSPSLSFRSFSRSSAARKEKSRLESLHSYLRLLPVLFLSILWNTPADLFALTSVHARATERVFHELHEAAKLRSSAKRSKPVHPLAAGIPKIPSEIADGISL